ncbi:hypothetical protein [Gemmatimonas sp.]|uniref:hypothetical protein n=1 Tax=Gemmatimonas sp. TaxID=1962908 RepID=UPI003F6F3CBE
MNEVLLRRKVAWALDVAERATGCASEDTRYVVLWAIQLGRWALAGVKLPYTTGEVTEWLEQVEEGANAAYFYEGNSEDFQTLHAVSAAKLALRAAIYVELDVTIPAIRFDIRDVTKCVAAALSERTGILNDPVEQQWRRTRWAEYVAGKVPMPVAPTNPRDFKRYLLSEDREIREEAIGCMAALDLRRPERFR